MDGSSGKVNRNGPGSSKNWLEERKWIILTFRRATKIERTRMLLMDISNFREKAKTAVKLCPKSKLLKLGFL
jgi:hypothetical protein